MTPTPIVPAMKPSASDEREAIDSLGIRSLAVCPYCGRLTESKGGRFAIHGDLLACRGSERPLGEKP